MATSVGLERSVETSLGQTVRVVPIVGHGWVEGSHRPIAPPSGFGMRPIRFWDYRDTVRRGGIGMVEEPGHPADGLWCVFCLRGGETRDFAANVGTFNVLLFDGDPGDPQDLGSPWPQDAYRGFWRAGFANIEQR